MFTIASDQGHLLVRESSFQLTPQEAEASARAAGEEPEPEAHRRPAGIFQVLFPALAPWAEKGALITWPPGPVWPAQEPLQSRRATDTDRPSRSIFMGLRATPGGVGHGSEGV